jgi:hypothetical protein
MMLDDAGVAFARDVITSTGDVVLARRRQKTISLSVTIVSGPEELAELVRDAQGETVLVGGFPAPDSDGLSAITIELPDLDGKVRSHPH